MNIQNLVAVTNGSYAARQSPLFAEGTDETTLVTEPTTSLSGLSGDTQKTAEEFETFLTLLTAQIKNQDPLAPLDSTQFVEQLATFSSLELQAKGNQTLDQIVALLQQQSDE